MRKRIVLGLLIIFILICLIIPKHSNEVIPVFNEQDYNYYIRDIDVSKADITTKNIVNNYNSYTILTIYPNVNEIYKKIIKINLYNLDSNKSLQANIDDFKEIYIDQLNKYSLSNEAQKIMYNGIKINQITFYVTNNQLDLIMSNKRLKLIS